MAKLSRIWDVQIALGTLAIDEHTFNLALALTDNANIGLSTTNRVLTITEADDLLDAGASDSDAVYKLAQDWFGQIPHITTLTIGYQDSAGSETVTDALAACTDAAPAWLYGLLLESRDASDVQDAADWAESAGRLFMTASNDSDIPTNATTDIASVLQDNNYMRTSVMYTEDADKQYPDAALMSNRFTFYPGSATFDGVRLSGVASDNLKESEYLFCKQKNCTTFEKFRNFSITQGGKVAGNEWVDVIRFRDWLLEQIKVAEVGLKVRHTNAYGKIPYTDDGIQMIVNALRGVLDLGVARGGIAPPEIDEDGNTIPSYKVSFPLAANVPTNDKANRILRDIKFSARLAGAIHTGEIKGALVYDFN